MNYLKVFGISVLIMSLVIACGSSKKTNDMNLKTPEVLLSEGDALVEARNYEEALKSYETLLVLHPTSDLHVDTQLRMAEAYGKLDKFEEQMELLLRVLKENIIPGYVPQIYVQLGKFYERAARFNPGVVDSDSTDYNKAMSYYERASRYEDSQDINAKAEALFRRGLIEAKRGNISQATLYYETVAFQYPDVPFATLAKIKLRDPNDISELSTDDTSMQTFYDTLGEQPSTPEVSEEEMTPVEDVENLEVE